MTAVDQPLRIAVLLSGTGRSLENLIAAIDRGTLRARIAVVVSSVADARGLEVAERAGIPAHTIARRDFASVDTHSQAIYEAVEAADAELIVLAGFLRKITVPPRWRERVLNMHPALLPDAAAYAAGKGRYGERVHTAVLAHGDVTSGATVHIVDDDYDTGPVVTRVHVPVLPDDTPETLAARVFAGECALYPLAIRAYVRSRPDLFGKRSPS